LSQGQITTLTAPAGPAVHDRSPPWEAPAETARGGNGKLRVLGLVAVGTVGAVVAWDLRRRGLPELDEAAEFAPHLLLATPLLAGLGMLAGRRPPTWAGLLLGAGAWSVLGAVWSVRWLVAAGGRLVGGSEDPLEFAKGLTWVPYTALVVLGLVVLVTVLALRAHPARTSCRTGGHRLLTFGAAAVALLGPLWVLALVPAMGLGARRPHRTAAVAWAGWVIQGVVALTLAANGEIPSSGLPALVLHPDAPTAVLLGVPLLLVAAFAGALATLPAEACRWDEPLRAYAPTSPIDWPEPEERGPLSDR
jgi:hypothetical protein